MLDDKELTEISMKESIRAKNERILKQNNMKRFYTAEEEKILREGLKNNIEFKDLSDVVKDFVKKG